MLRSEGAAASSIHFLLLPSQKPMMYSSKSSLVIMTSAALRMAAEIFVQSVPPTEARSCGALDKTVL